MKKLVSLVMAFLVLGMLIGCSLLDMSSSERKDFYQDCVNKRLLVQVTIDPISDEQVTVKCVPRIVLVPIED